MACITKYPQAEELSLEEQKERGINTLANPLYDICQEKRKRSVVIAKTKELNEAELDNLAKYFDMLIGMGRSKKESND